MYIVHVTLYTYMFFSLKVILKFESSLAKLLHLFRPKTCFLRTWFPMGYIHVINKKVFNLCNG